MDSLNAPLPAGQRASTQTRASEQLTRIKNIREGIAIGRASKGSKVTPMGSSRVGG